MTGGGRGVLVAAWRGALACFVVAAVTGAVFRFQAGQGLDTGLIVTHVRHAHSHLMYFGWGTPALMALLVAAIAERSGRPVPRVMRSIFWGVFVTAFVMWPLFLVLGYEPVDVGPTRMPLPVIVSGLVMIVWYGFAALYVRETRGVRRTRALRLFDLAIAFFVLATFGAWGLSLKGPLGIEDPRVTLAMTHFFLDLFSEGWFVLGVLGLAWHHVAPDERGGGASIALLALGLPLTFALAMRPEDLPPLLRVAASIAGVVTAFALLAQIVPLWRRLSGSRAWIWRVPLALLAIGAVGRMIAAGVPSIGLATVPGLRILYLHLLLLGFVTLGLWAAAESAFGRVRVRVRAWLHAAVLALIASLVPISALWPEPLGGTWAYHAASWIALLPPIAVIAVLLASKSRSQPLVS